MTAKTKKLIITTEEHEVVVVRTNSATVNRFCPSCGTEVEMLTLDSAVRASECTGREVIRRLAADEIHTIETASGHLLVCRASLQNTSSTGARR